MVILPVYAVEGESSRGLFSVYASLHTYCIIPCIAITFLLFTVLLCCTRGLHVLIFGIDDDDDDSTDVMRVCDTFRLLEMMN